MLSCRLHFHTHAALRLFHRFSASKRRVAVATSARGMPDQIVVCGGGIIGVATAYYLTLQGIRPVLVEKKGIACAASGVGPSLFYCQFPYGSFDSDKVLQGGISTASEDMSRAMVA